jgi:hypothetical protein
MIKNWNEFNENYTPNWDEIPYLDKIPELSVNPVEYFNKYLPFKLKNLDENFANLLYDLYKKHRKITKFGHRNQVSGFNFTIGIYLDNLNEEELDDLDMSDRDMSLYSSSYLHIRLDKDDVDFSELGITEDSTVYYMISPFTEYVKTSEESGYLETDMKKTQDIISEYFDENKYNIVEIDNSHDESDLDDLDEEGMVEFFKNNHYYGYNSQHIIYENKPKENKPKVITNQTKQEQKSKITMKVSDNPTLTNGANLNVSAWKNGYMMDTEITHKYRELIKLGLEEDSECDMSYYGDLTKDEMIDKLNNMGFNAIPA